MSRKLNSDILFSIITQGGPALFAIIFIPILISNYGNEKFGIFTFFWALLNYVHFLDMGITRSITKLIAAEQKQHSTENLAIIKLGFVILSIAGLIGFFILFLGNNWLALAYLKLTPELVEETKNSLIALSTIIPSLLIFSFLKSTLEGLLEFKIANLLQFVSNIVSYLAPLSLLLFSKRLDLALIMLSVYRWILVFIAYIYVNKKLVINWKSIPITSQTFKGLYKHGFWFAIIAISNPLLIYIDRIIIAHFIPASELVYYNTPFEIVTRFWLLPIAVTRILFPVFSSHQGVWNAHAKEYFKKGIIWIILIAGPPTLVVLFGAKYILTLWLDATFAQNSSLILQILVIGIFFNCINWVSASFFQTTRWIHWMAIIPVVEFLFYLPILYWFILKYSVVGAAAAWSLRLCVDFLITSLLFYYYRRKA